MGTHLGWRVIPPAFGYKPSGYKKRMRAPKSSGSSVLRAGSNLDQQQLPIGPLAEGLVTFALRLSYLSQSISVDLSYQENLCVVGLLSFNR